MRAGGLSETQELRKISGRIGVILVYQIIYQTLTGYHSRRKRVMVII